MMHPVFDQFPRWRGPSDGRYQIDFLGVKTDPKVWGTIEASPPGEVEGGYPKVGEQLYEWISVLNAVQCAGDSFTMIELGAGWGPWLVRAARALQCISKKPFHLVGVEGEKGNYEWMVEHFKNNGLDPSEHVLLNAAVASKDGTQRFTRVDPPPHFYGSRLVDEDTDPQHLLNHAVEIPCVSLNTLLEPHDRVDLIHADVQGAEGEILTASIEALTNKVKELVLGTHSHALHNQIENFMRYHGWLPRWSFARGSQWATFWGEITFRDGCQVWINPNL